MSCERYERDLALFVEGDLRTADVPAVEQHLASCLRCQAFERGLRSSQAALRSLADAELPEHAIAAARARVLAAVRTRPRTVWNMPRWAWVAFAGGLPVALCLALFWLGGPREPAPGPTVTQMGAQPTPAPQVVAEQAVPPDSTKPQRRAVSPSVQRPRHPRVDRLSPEDADQLARALVLVSRLQREDGEPLREREATDEARTPLARIATSDPNVVIYWQFDPSGG
jgi:hypothetical protein